MPTLSTPRFGAVFTLVGDKADFPAAEKALREKAKKENVPLFIQHSRDSDLSVQFIQSLQGNPKIQSALSRVQDDPFVQFLQEDKKIEDLKGVRVYTGRLDSTLGRLAAVFDAPFYALRSLAGALVQGKKPGTQSFVRKAVNAIASVGYLLATHVVGLVTSLPEIGLAIRSALQGRESSKVPVFFSPKAVTDDGFKLPR